MRELEIESGSGSGCSKAAAIAAMSASVSSGEKCRMRGSRSVVSRPGGSVAQIADQDGADPGEVKAAEERPHADLAAGVREPNELPDIGDRLPALLAEERLHEIGEFVVVVEDRDPRRASDHVTCPGARRSVAVPFCMVSKLFRKGRAITTT